MGCYDIINFKNYEDGKLNIIFLKIGEYDGKIGLLKIDCYVIYWFGGVMFFFYGFCSLECFLGIFKVVVKFICCWICRICFRGSISNVFGVILCI